MIKSIDLNPDSRPMNGLYVRNLLFCLCLLVTVDLKAEVLRWPQACLKGDLQIKNLRKTDLSVWLQSFSPSLTSETELILKAESTMHYPLVAKNSIERYSILNFNENGSVQINFNCSNKNYSATNFEGGVLTYRKTNLEQNEVWLQNLFTDENQFLIEYQNKKFQTLDTEVINLASLSSTSVLLKTNLAWSYFRVSAKNRFSAFNLNASGSEGPTLVQPQTSFIDSNASYFLIGPRTGSGDEFIVKITNPEMIVKAKNIIANPKLEKIVFGKIQKGFGGFNRNWSKKEKSFWSWSVSEVTNFADIASTACNGIPQVVEDRLSSWLQDPGKICFWNYRLKKEISAEEVAKPRQQPSMHFAHEFLQP